MPAKSPRHWPVILLLSIIVQPLVAFCYSLPVMAGRYAGRQDGPFRRDSNHSTDSESRILFNPFDVINEASVALNSLPPELRMIFKKLTKQDLSTRIKGLEELARWAQHGCAGSEEFATARPQFVKAFGACVVDPERQIRELALRAILAVVRREKRWLSPVAKEILYPWIGSLRDPVATVASVGRLAFDTCFGADRHVDVARLAFSVTVPRALHCLTAPPTGGQADEAVRLERTFALIYAINNLIFILENAPPPNLQTLAEEAFFKDISTSLRKVLEECRDAQARGQLYTLLLVSLDDKDEQRLITPASLISLLDEILSDLSTTVYAIRVLARLNLGQRPPAIEALCAHLEAHLALDIPKKSITELARVVQSIDSDEGRQRLFTTLLRVIRAFKGPDTTRLGLIWKLPMTMIRGTSGDATGDYNDDGTATDQLSARLLEFLVENPRSARSLLEQVLPPLLCAQRHPEKSAIGILHEPALATADKLDFLMAFPEEALSSESSRAALSDWLQTISMDVLDDCAQRIYQLASTTGAPPPSHQWIILTATSRMIEAHDTARVLSHIEQIVKYSGPLHPLGDLALDQISGGLGHFAIDDRLAICMALLSLDPHQRPPPPIDRDMAIMAAQNEENHAILHEYTLQKAQILSTVRLPRENDALLQMAREAVLTDSTAMAVLYSLLAPGQQSPLPTTLDLTELREQALQALLSLWHNAAAGRDPNMTIEMVRKWQLQLLQYYPSWWSLIVAKELECHPTVLQAIRDHLEHSEALYSLKVTAPFPSPHQGSRHSQLWPEEEGADVTGCILLTALSAAPPSELIDTASNLETLILMSSFAAILVEEQRYRRLSQVMTITTVAPPLQKIEAPTPLLSAALSLLGSIKASKDLLDRIVREIPSLSPARSTLLLAQSLGLERPSRVERPEGEGDSDALESASSLETIISELVEAFECHDRMVAEHIQLERHLWTLFRATDHHATALKPFLNVFWQSLRRLSQTPTISALFNLIRAFSHLCLHRAVPHLTLSLAPPQDTLKILRSTPWLPVKAVCRARLMQCLDEALEGARLRLAKTLQTEAAPPCEGELLGERQDDANYALLLPWGLSDALFGTPADRDQQEDAEWIVNRLFALDVFLCLAEGASEVAQLSLAYSGIFRERLADGYLRHLLCRLLGWMDARGDDEDEEEGKSDACGTVNLSQMEFTAISLEHVPLNLEQYAAHLLFRCIKAFPCDVRGWYETIPDKRASIRFRRCCTAYMSPLLIHRELHRIRQAAKGAGSDKLQLKVEQTSTSCSVLVRYHLEEFSVSFQLSIPTAYPLLPIRVSSGERLGISEARWRSWLLSVQTLLSQNLAIIEVIRQWRSNAERTLEGIEPCAICYCVLQPGDKTLPSPACKTCRNRFHSACLYKWFKTHGQATCPMCRSLF